MRNGTRPRREYRYYAVRIEDPGPGDFVKFDCAVCHHVALLTPDAAEGRAQPRGEGYRPQRAAPVPRLREEWAGSRFDQMAKSGRVDRRQRRPDRGTAGASACVLCRITHLLENPRAEGEV
jgi:hypothetical protein